MKKVFRYSAVWIFLITVCSGCSYNPGSSNNGPGQTVPPKTGSVYIYNNTPIDTNGHPMTDSAYTTIDSVTATGMTYNGKSNVTHISTRNLKTGLVSSSYINYEANGDVSEYVGLSFLSLLGITYPDWATYPMQSHASVGRKAFDSTVNYPVPGIGTVPIHMMVLDTISYINTGSFILNNSSLPVVDVKQTTNFNGTIAVLIPFSTNEVTTGSFAPSIGYYADITRQPVKIPLGIAPAVKGSEMTLVSYQLK